ncbi:MAG: DUF1553 domain-containing protein, partial [Planctomycetes bacterium]|nr:DUF1553 domain-containing protein [Planctomycetota bacterium]
ILRGGFAWRLMKPKKASSARRAALRIQKDGSVLAAGRNPAQDDYTVIISTDVKNVTGIRLEALTHPSLPGKGLSRGNGNFVLTRFEISVKSRGKKTSQPVKIAAAAADYSQPGFPVTAAIDGNPKTGWAVSGDQRKGQNRMAVFTFAQPIAAGPGTVITVRLRHESKFKRHTIGRFRLSLTTALKPALDKDGLPADVLAVLKVQHTNRSASQRNVLTAFFSGISPQLRKPREQIAAAEQRKRAVQKSFATTLIAESTKPRMMRILPRGNWLDDSGEIVQPAVPSFLKSAAKRTGRDNRLGLARWIVSAENPLAARVFVNRSWKLMYGRGIVSSLDDFGSQGASPSHPRLLDWLAVEFRASGWNVKRLMKLMAMSGTYRQSSLVSERVRKIDPFNRWLSHQSVYRLDAEMIRDNALAASGLLVKTIGGRSVKPYQPAGYWSHLNFPKRVYKHDAGEGQYRRGLYSYWCRTFLHPSLLAFDAPTREECTVSRARSNTPLQALVLLNDPTYIEAARVLAERVLHDGGKTDESRIRYLYRIVLTRKPQPAESALLGRLLNKHRAQYKADPKAAAQLNAIGQRAPAKDIGPAELAAWTSLTRVVLNLHETITRH